MPCPKSKADKLTSLDERHGWKNGVEFSLATLGYCIGLSTLTRFPYVVMKNGGGAFLLPFIISMIIGGIPLFYLEILLGQFGGRSPLTIWSLCPAFKGIGYAATMLSLIVALYYMPFTWSTLFLVNSLDVDIPWRTCNNTWNTENCRDRYNTSLSIITNQTASPSEEYWNYHILGITTAGLSDIGSVRWQLALSHLFCWVVVFLCSMKGAVTAGKVVYVTATLPYVLLAALLVRGTSLEGSLDGIIFFLKPDFDKLSDITVWIEASVQVFYQLGPGWGGLITMASYNKFHHRCYIDAVIISIVNLLTALIGGVAIFSILGFMAHRYGVPVSEVAKSGPGLAFVAYPEAIAQMPWSPVWSVVFFLTLMCVAVDSQFGMFDTFVSGFLDFFPRLRKWDILITGVFAAACYLIGLVFCTEGGIFVFQLLDWYGAVLTFTMIGFFECIVIGYIYGINRFYSDIELMFGGPPNKIFKAAWLFVTPALLGVIGFVGIWNMKPPRYQFTHYEYPDWAILIGWSVAFFSFMPIPLIMIYTVLKAPGTAREKLRQSFSPDTSWLPNSPELIDEYYRRWHAPKRTAAQTQNEVSCPLTKSSAEEPVV